jgi:hypothetical protein
VAEPLRRLSDPCAVGVKVLARLARI